MSEIRCVMLEIEVQDLKKKNKELEEQIARIQKVMNNEEKGKATLIDLTGDESEKEEFIQLMIENKVLECEKAKAETELCFWKDKVKRLVSQVCELESKLNMMGMNETSIEVNDGMLHLDKVNLVSISTPECDIQKLETGAKQENRDKVRKRLQFEEDGCSSKKFAPSTPGFHPPPPSSGVIDISDEDDMDGFTSAKRKRFSKIVTSDDETSYDDNAPICTLLKKGHKNEVYDDNAPISTLIKKHHKYEVKEDVSRRPLKRLKKLDDITIDLFKTGNSSSDEEEEEEDESLGGFIVESGESASESESESGPESGDDTESCDESEDGLNEFKATLDKIRRKKELKTKWGLEGDMLADFGKDPELCMRVVCVLYRQQTEVEKAGQVTIFKNERGFSQPDALRASKLAEFLTDGGNGDLNKTVEELKRYDSKGVELCMKLATKYSKQLFWIYHNKEDPYFCP